MRCASQRKTNINMLNGLVTMLPFFEKINGQAHTTNSERHNEQQTTSFPAGSLLLVTPLVTPSPSLLHTCLAIELHSQVPLFHSLPTPPPALPLFPIPAIIHPAVGRESCTIITIHISAPLVARLHNTRVAATAIYYIVLLWRQLQGACA